MDYNDDTADVTYAYDRLGRQTTVTDAVGTRVFAYDPATLQLKSETIGGLTPAVLTRYYDPTAVKGRLIGMGLGAGYTVGYGYDQVGRMMSVAWTANGSSDPAVYSRVAGSELLSGYTTLSGFGASYGYEPKRDLKTRVANRWGGSVVSQYDYRSEACRTEAKPATTAREKATSAQRLPHGLPALALRGRRHGRQRAVR